MRTRIRIGPFTFGSSGTRLSLWSGGTGLSVPLFKRNAGSFGKVRLGVFSFYFGGKRKRELRKKTKYRNLRSPRDTHKLNAQRRGHKQGYEPWTTMSDKKLEALYLKGKTVQELSETFERSNGAIRSRIKKLSLRDKY